MLLSIIRYLSLPSKNMSWKKKKIKLATICEFDTNKIKHLKHQRISRALENSEGSIIRACSVLKW